MNARFFELPAERQAAMRNAGLEVFAKQNYAKASMEEAARLAGVSKALLFHYFENKRGFYLYLYEYATGLVIREMSAAHDYSETDFFNILINAQLSKIAILHAHPYAMQFITNAYFEEDPCVRPALADSFSAIVADSSARFLARADASKLREGVSAEALLNIVLWMADGFMRSRTPEQLQDLDALNDVFLAHVGLLKKQFYKEEFL